MLPLHMSVGYVFAFCYCMNTTVYCSFPDIITAHAHDDTTASPCSPISSRTRLLLLRLINTTISRVTERERGKV